MLPAMHRLRQFRDFQRVYKTGQAEHGRIMRMTYTTNNHAATRFGIVIPNKLIKKATERNKKKRQIRAALQTLLPRVVPGYDVVVSAKLDIVDASFEEIASELASLLQKARIV